jgi:hypothetical protein
VVIWVYPVGTHTHTHTQDHDVEEAVIASDLETDYIVCPLVYGIRLE